MYILDSKMGWEIYIDFKIRYLKYIVADLIYVFPNVTTFNLIMCKTILLRTAN